MIKSQSVWAIIIACGKSEQIGSEVDTAFLQLGEQPVLTYSIQAFDRCPEVDGIVVVSTKERIDSVVGMARMFGSPKLKKVVAGTIQKNSSIKAALNALEEEDPDIILIHEASQPCISTHVISETIKGARRYGVAAAAERLDIPVAVVPKGLKVAKTLDSNTIWTLEMPVAVKREALEKMLGIGKRQKGGPIDDPTFYAKLYTDAYLVQTPRANLRVRTVSDIQIISAAMRASAIHA